MKKTTIIAIATTALAAICIFIHFFIPIGGSRDPFQENITKLIERKSGQDIRDASYNLRKMEPSIVPRLIGELNIITNELTKRQIYTFCNNGYMPDDAADHLLGRTALFRSEIYSLIAGHDAHTYVEMLTDLCHSNNPELCLALRGVNCQDLLSLPTNELSALTSTLSAKQGSVETDEGKRLCISEFFKRLALAQHEPNSSKAFLNLEKVIGVKTNE